MSSQLTNTSGYKPLYKNLHLTKQEKEDITTLYNNDKRFNCKLADGDVVTMLKELISFKQTRDKEWSFFSVTQSELQFLKLQNWARDHKCSEEFMNILLPLVKNRALFFTKPIPDSMKNVLVKGLAQEDLFFYKKLYLELELDRIHFLKKNGIDLYQILAIKLLDNLHFYDKSVAFQDLRNVILFDYNQIDVSPKSDVIDFIQKHLIEIKKYIVTMFEGNVYFYFTLIDLITVFFKKIDHIYSNVLENNNNIFVKKKINIFYNIAARCFNYGIFEKRPLNKDSIEFLFLFAVIKNALLNSHCIENSELTVKNSPINIVIGRSLGRYEDVVKCLQNNTDMINKYDSIFGNDVENSAKIEQLKNSFATEDGLLNLLANFLNDHRSLAFKEIFKKINPMSSSDLYENQRVMTVAFEIFNCHISENQGRNKEVFLLLKKLFNWYQIDVEVNHQNDLSSSSSLDALLDEPTSYTKDDILGFFENKYRSFYCFYLYKNLEIDTNYNIKKDSVNEIISLYNYVKSNINQKSFRIKNNGSINYLFYLLKQQDKKSPLIAKCPLDEIKRVYFTEVEFDTHHIDLENSYVFIGLNEENQKLFLFIHHEYYENMITNTLTELDKPNIRRASSTQRELTKITKKIHWNNFYLYKRSSENSSYECAKTVDAQAHAVFKYFPVFKHYYDCYNKINHGEFKALDFIAALELDKVIYNHLSNVFVHQGYKYPLLDGVYTSCFYNSFLPLFLNDLNSFQIEKNEIQLTPKVVRMIQLHFKLEGLEDKYQAFGFMCVALLFVYFSSDLCFGISTRSPPVLRYFAVAILNYIKNFRESNERLVNKWNNVLLGGLNEWNTDCTATLFEKMMIELNERKEEDSKNVPIFNNIVPHTIQL